MAKRVLTDMEKEAIRKVQGVEADGADAGAEGEPVDLSKFQRPASEVDTIKPPALAGSEKPAANVEKLDMDKLDQIVDSMASEGPSEKHPAASEEEPEDGEGRDDGPQRDEALPMLRRSLCPVCGWDRSKSLKEQPTDEDKKEYVRSVLGERPFERDFQIFGGEVVLRFRELTAVESSILRMEMEKRVALGRYRTKDAIAVAFIQLRAMTTLAKISRPKGKTTDFNVVRNLVDALAARGTVTVSDIGKTELEVLEEKLFTSKPESLVRACAICLQKFEDILTVLGSRATDADFYSGLTDS